MKNSLHLNDPRWLSRLSFFVTRIRRLELWIYWIFYSPILIAIYLHLLLWKSSYYFHLFLSVYECSINFRNAHEKWAQFWGILFEKLFNHQQQTLKAHQSLKSRKHVVIKNLINVKFNEITLKYHTYFEVPLLWNVKIYEIIKFHSKLWENNQTK